MKTHSYTYKDAGRTDGVYGGFIDIGSTRSHLKEHNDLTHKTIVPSTIRGPPPPGIGNRGFLNGQRNRIYLDLDISKKEKKKFFLGSVGFFNVPPGRGGVCWWVSWVGR